MIEFAVESRPVRAYQAAPSHSDGPGVLVLHAWWGLTPVFTGVCDRLAREGFVALAPDLYNGQTADKIEEAERLAQSLDPEATSKVVNAAVERLREHEGVRGDRMGVIGFSLGSGFALTMGGPVAAIVTFYGTTYPEWSWAKAAFQGHFAENDPYEPAEYVRGLEDSLRRAGRDVTFYTYPGTSHWFFEPNRPEYNAQAADLAWRRTLDFLRLHLSD